VHVALDETIDERGDLRGVVPAVRIERDDEVRTSLARHLSESEGVGLTGAGRRAGQHANVETDPIGCGEGWFSMAAAIEQQQIEIDATRVERVRGDAEIADDRLDGGRTSYAGITTVAAGRLQGWPCIVLARIPRCARPTRGLRRIARRKRAGRVLYPPCESRMSFRAASSLPRAF
jgi:hypothetical protein